MSTAYGKSTCSGCGRLIGHNVERQHRKACPSPPPAARCDHCGKWILDFRVRSGHLADKKFCSALCMDRFKLAQTSGDREGPARNRKAASDHPSTTGYDHAPARGPEEAGTLSTASQRRGTTDG